MNDVDFFQSKEIRQDGGKKTSSGSKGNGEKVDEPEGDLQVHIFINSRRWVFRIFHLSHISSECDLKFSFDKLVTFFSGSNDKGAVGSDRLVEEEGEANIIVKIITTTIKIKKKVAR